MATVPTLQDQLAEIRMLVDRSDPARVEAKAEFAAMVAKITTQADDPPKINGARIGVGPGAMM